MVALGISRIRINFLLRVVVFSLFADSLASHQIVFFARRLVRLARSNGICKRHICLIPGSAAVQKIE